MAAPAWFVAHLEALRQLPGSRPASAQTLVKWTAQLADGEAPSRATVIRWLSGATLPQDFRALELLVLAVRERTREPSLEARGTLLRVGWWRDQYEQAVADSRWAASPNGHAPTVVYQGLKPFARRDADRFFGRDAAIESLRIRLDALHRSPAGGPLVVLGPSGTGKTSLLQAGLLPALEAHGLVSDAAVSMWPAAVLTPGADPMASLRRALRATVTPSCPPTSLDESEQAEIAPSTDREAATCRLVVVDQFEQIFQVAEEPRRRFLDALLDMAGEPDDRVRSSPSHRSLVIIACRNEFYAELRALPALRTALDVPFNLDPLTTDELTEAIVMPARQSGLTVRPELVSRIAEDAGVTSTGTVEGKLPLVSHLLEVMNRAGPMTPVGYDRAGGIGGAVAHTAEQAWHDLQSHGVANLALSLLVQLVQVTDSSGHDTRRVLPRQDLLDVAHDAAATAQALETLSAARLVTIDQDTVQITHDALLHAWQRLRDTIDAERGDIVLRQNIERRARQWHDAGRPNDQLFRGTALADAHRVAAVGTGALALSSRSHVFLTAADEQERRDARRRRRLQVSGLGVVLVIVVVGAVAIVQSIRQYQISQRAVFSEVVAQAKEVRDSNVALSAQLFLTAYRMEPTAELYTALLDTQNRALSRPLAGHEGRVRAVAYHGPTMITAGDDGTIRLWDSQTRPSAPGEGVPAAAVVPGPGPVTALAVVPGRAVLISSHTDTSTGQNALRLWDVADQQQPRSIGAEIPTGGVPITGLSASPDGTVMIATLDDGTTRLWRIGDPALPIDLGVRLAGASSSVYGSGVSVSPDGATLAIAGDGGTVRMWDLRVPGAPRELPALPSGVAVTRAVAFSPVPGVLVSGGGDGLLRVWDVSDPANARLLTEAETDPGKSILSVAVSPDGSTTAAGDGDNTVTLWNSSDPSDLTRLGEPLTGHNRGVGKLAFSPDNRTLLTGGADPIARAWTLPATQLTASRGPIIDLAHSRDGRTLAATDLDNTQIRLWDVTDTNAPILTSPPLLHGVNNKGAGFSVTFSPDDTVLVSGAGNVVRQWDLRDRTNPRPLGPELVLPSAVGNVALSPDGRTLAVAGADGVTRLFTMTARGAAPIPTGVPLPSTPGELVLSAQFSPDGEMLATAGTDRKVWLWDVRDPSSPRQLGPPLTGHTDKVFGLAFHPTAPQLASVGFDHTTRLWDTSDPTRSHQLGPPLVRQPNVLGSVAWTSDGTTLITGSHEPSVALWNTADRTRPVPIGEPLAGHHTDYVTSVSADPTRPVIASAGQDHTVHLWNLDPESAARRICTASPGVLSPAAWDTYVSPDVDYDPPCDTREQVAMN